MAEKLTFIQKIITLLIIFLLGLFTYCSMVLISHFSENHKLINYTYLDSIKAIYGKSNIASEFIIGFAVLVVGTIVFSFLIKKIFDLIKK